MIFSGELVTKHVFRNITGIHILPRRIVYSYNTRAIITQPYYYIRTGLRFVPRLDSCLHKDAQKLLSAIRLVQKFLLDVAPTRNQEANSPPNKDTANQAK